MIKCLLVAVCDYSNNESLCNLDWCYNDLIKIRTSIIKGLNVNEKHIDVCGENKTVTVEELIDSIEYKSYDLCKEDIFIFYFSGHGGNGNISLSNGNYSLQDLINNIDNLNAKAKIIILDCCHAGDFSLDKKFELDINTNLDHFTGSGIAVLASCKSDEQSSFNDKNQISVYTGFLCDALNNHFINRKGKKSLESIVTYIRRRSIIWNSQNPDKFQNPIYRSFIGGTVYFDVEEYKPYSVKDFYEENSEYIIYSVKPMHYSMTKRYSVMIILKYPSDNETIAEYEKEIVEKVKHIEIFENDKSEKALFGKPANIIWCYFGYDEDDMVDSNYICHTTWVDSRQNKNCWYKQNKNSYFVNDVYFEGNNSYNAIKLLKNPDLDSNQFISDSKKFTNNIITVGLEFINLFREYENKLITENQLVNLVKPLVSVIHSNYFKLSDMDIPPNELHSWCNCQMNIAGDVYDFTLYFDKKTMNKWTQSNRINLMRSTIVRFESDLEKYNILSKDI